MLDRIKNTTALAVVLTFASIATALAEDVAGPSSVTDALGAFGSPAWATPNAVPQDDGPRIGPSTVPFVPQPDDLGCTVPCPFAAYPGEDLPERPIEAPGPEFPMPEFD